MDGGVPMGSFEGSLAESLAEGLLTGPNPATAPPAPAAATTQAELRERLVPSLAAELGVSRLALESLPLAALIRIAESASSSGTSTALQSARARGGAARSAVDTADAATIVDAMPIDVFDDELKRSSVYGANATALSTLRSFLLLFGAPVQALGTTGDAVARTYRDSTITIFTKLRHIDPRHLHACDEACLLQLVRVEMLTLTERFLYSRFEYRLLDSVGVGAEGSADARSGAAASRRAGIEGRARATLSGLLNRTVGELAALPRAWLRVLAARKTADRVIAGGDDVESAAEELVARFVASWTEDDSWENAQEVTSAALHTRALAIMRKLTNMTTVQLLGLSVQAFAELAEHRTNWK